MKKAFLLGSDVSNSLSPFIHNYWLKKYNIDGLYEPISLSLAAAPGFLKDFVKYGFVGGNVTMPYKKMASWFCDRSVSPVEGAINSLWLENGKTVGDNSDIMGFDCMLRKHSLHRDKREAACLILGNGGAAAAVAHVLDEREYKAYIASSEPKSVNERTPLIPIISYSDIKEHKYWLVVNTTPCAIKNYENEKWLEKIDLEQIYKNAEKDLAVIDIVYNPKKTILLEKAQSLGIEKAYGGLAMLLGQAAYGFSKWFGVKPEVDNKMMDFLKDIL